MDYKVIIDKHGQPVLTALPKKELEAFKQYIGQIKDEELLINVQGRNVLSREFKNTLTFRFFPLTAPVQIRALNLAVKVAFKNDQPEQIECVAQSATGDIPLNKNLYVLLMGLSQGINEIDQEYVARLAKSGRIFFQTLDIVEKTYCEDKKIQHQPKIVDMILNMSEEVRTSVFKFLPEGSFKKKSKESVEA